MTTTASPARAYEEYFVPAMFAPLAGHTLSAAALRPGERVLDLACGTGVVARQAARLVGPSGRVVGLDVSPVMLEEARAHVPPGGADVAWVQGDAVTTDLADAGFDVVVCQQGLQFFPDRAEGARRMHRVLDDDGRAVVTTWCGVDEHPFIAQLADIELVHLSALGAGFTHEDVTRPFSLGEPELRELLTSAGFGSVETAPVTIEARFATPDRFIERLELAYAAVVPTFAADPRAFADYVTRVAEDSRELVDRHRQGDSVVVPLHAVLAVARP
jgi:SAM-dependent methyltransferase